MAFRDVVNLRGDSSTKDKANPGYGGEPFAIGISADIEAVGGGEVIRGRQIEANIKYIVQLRHRTDVTHKTRVEVTGGQYAGSILNVARITPRRERGRPPLIELDCTELKN